MLLQYHGALLSFPGRSVDIGSSEEEIEVDLARLHLDEGDRTIVAGFGLGWLGLWAAYAAGAENVIGFEANETLARLCQGQICIDGQRVLVVHAALVPEKNPVGFGDSGGYVLYPGNRWQDAEVVKGAFSERDFIPYTYTLSEAYRTYNADCVVLDIEGGEFDVLTDEALRRTRKLILEVHAWKRPTRVRELEYRIKGAGLEFTHLQERETGKGRQLFWVAIRVF